MATKTLVSKNCLFFYHIEHEQPGFHSLFNNLWIFRNLMIIHWNFSHFRYNKVFNMMRWRLTTSIVVVNIRHFDCLGFWSVTNDLPSNDLMPIEFRNFQHSHTHTYLYTCFNEVRFPVSTFSFLPGASIYRIPFNVIILANIHCIDAFHTGFHFAWIKLSRIHTKNY